MLRNTLIMNQYLITPAVPILSKSFRPKSSQHHPSSHLTFLRGRPSSLHTLDVSPEFPRKLESPRLTLVLLLRVKRVFLSRSFKVIIAFLSHYARCNWSIYSVFSCTGHSDLELFLLSKCFLIYCQAFLTFITSKSLKLSFTRFAFDVRQQFEVDLREQKSCPKS